MFLVPGEWFTVDNAESGKMFRSELDRLAGVPPPRVLLATDFDGTLAPIVQDPGAARAVPAALRALGDLQARLARVTILSGRATDALEGLVPVPGVRLRGDYGLGRPTPEEIALLDRLAGELAPLAGRHPGAKVERKPGSLSVHYRDAPEAGPAIEKAASAAAERLGLRWHRGKLVVEVLPPRAGKERALRADMDEARCEAVVFAGDDVGDTGCFALLAGLDMPHLAIGVASPEAPSDLFRDCDSVLDGPASFAAFLTSLAAWSARPGPADPGSGG